MDLENSMANMALDGSRRRERMDDRTEEISPRSQPDFDHSPSFRSSTNKQQDMDMTALNHRHQVGSMTKQTSMRGFLQHATSDRSLCSTRGWSTLDSVHSSSRELEWIEGGAEDSKSSFSDSFCSFESNGDSPTPLEVAASTMFTKPPDEVSKPSLVRQQSKTMRRGLSFRREMSLSLIKENTHD